MLDKHDKILYVGKARNLKKRVSSYFRKKITEPKTEILMRHVVSVKIIVTHTENEALILESQLIKQHLPRYNISLRDDKSYPYIFLSGDQFSRLTIHRGPKKAKGQYFGPYPNASAVHETIHLLQKLFRIRSCANSFFSARTRPCLQYQIKRCTAPCVSFISAQEYAEKVKHAVMFLEGKSDEIINELNLQMDKAAKILNFELAAQFRNLILDLREIQSKQYVRVKKGDIDVIAVVREYDMTCISVLTIRHGRILGHKVFFPHIPEYAVLSEILSAFLSQYYLRDVQDIPKEIITNIKLANAKILKQVLTEKSLHQVKLSFNVRGERTQWVKMTTMNAKEALNSRLSNKINLHEKFVDLQKVLALSALPERIECFDISHTMGEATQASCVVFTVEGPAKGDYRRFNIKDITPGDDLAAMRQALERRYSAVQKGEGDLPDILIIDGGKGQLKQAEEIVTALSLPNILLIGVAKGVERKPGAEVLYLSSQGEALQIENNSPAFHLIQQVRDEAHRFAITGHRHRREKARRTSMLEEIAGVGVKRRSDLLRFFGGLQGVLKASVDDLIKVPGINRTLAQMIYDHLRK